MQIPEKFQIFELSGTLLKALAQKGFEAPTPIQEKVIPLLLDNKIDIIGQAQTGTGKTAAFGLPILEHLDLHVKKISALILTPTRELAIQITEELNSLKGEKAIKILPVYGGQAIEMQIKHLKKGVNIVVGTPGRILDHLRRKTIRLDQLDFAVLDEADEILNMGFLEDIERILQQTNADKRTLLFSATMPPEIRAIAKNYMGPTEFVQIKTKQLAVSQTDQIYFQVAESNKFEALCRIIDIETDFYGLVFCRTKVDADRIAHRLIDRGYDADALHGDLSQSQREKVMARFRKHHINVLVATDVAARGIDVSDLTHVINFALPQDPDSYIHRIGRTGRAGKEGTAITFITPEEENKLTFIERKTKSKIRLEKVPRVKDIIYSKVSRIKEQVDTIIQTDVYRDYLDVAHGLLEQGESEQVIAALIKAAFEDELDPASYNEIRDIPPRIPGETRLFIARGRKDGMTPKRLTSFITKNVQISPKKIKNIQLQHEFSFVSVPFKEAELILQVFRKQKNGKQPVVVKAKPKKTKKK